MECKPPDAKDVSILSRSCDREQPLTPNHTRGAISVSILSRSCDREQRRTIRGQTSPAIGFNPLPVLRPGATAISTTPTRLQSFNPLPVLRPGATLLTCTLRVCNNSFNPLPVLRPGATIIAVPSCNARTGFNPLPVLRPGATCHRLAVPEDKRSSGFNPLPVLRPGATPRHTRCLPALKVSILSRSCDREQQQNYGRVSVPVRFQSSPGLATGSNVYYSAVSAAL